MSKRTWHYPKRILQASLVSGVASLSALWYFANKLDENSFIRKHYKWASQSVAGSFTSPDEKITLYKRTLHHTNNFIFQSQYDFQLFLAMAAIGLTNELWKNEVTFRALSYLIFTYMNFAFLSVSEENHVNYSDKKQVFFRGVDNDANLLPLSHNVGAIPVRVITCDPTLPFVSDVTLREGRTSAFKSNENDFELGTYIAGFTQGLISLTSSLKSAEYFAEKNGVVLLTVPEKTICGAQHCCKTEYPPDEYEYMVPGINSATVVGVAHLTEGKFTHFEYNENFSGDIAKLIVGVEAREIFELMPDSHPKKHALLAAVNDEFDAAAHFKSHLVETREDHYRLTQTKLKKQAEDHPYIARMF